LESVQVQNKLSEKEKCIFHFAKNHYAAILGDTNRLLEYAKLVGTHDLVRVLDIIFDKLHEIEEAAKNG